MQITKGKINKPQRVCIYGPEGIGKTTLASKFPEPVFIDTEGSTNQIDCARLPAPTTGAMLIEEVNWLADQKPAGVKTLIIDTADWAEKLLQKQAMATLQIKNMEAANYGKAYVYSWEEFGRLLTACDRVINAGIGVVFTAHAMIRKFEQPDELGAYDRWELKLQNSAKANICGMLKEWCDLVIFCNYEITTFTTKNDKVKAAGGNRVMYTSHSPAWDAKNRHGLPEKMPMDYASIKEAIEGGTTCVAAPKKEEQQQKVLAKEEFTAEDLPWEIPPEEPAASTEGLPVELVGLMDAAGVTVDDVRAAVAYKGYMPGDMEVKDYPQDFIRDCLIGAWPAVFEVIKAIKSEV